MSSGANQSRHQKTIEFVDDPLYPFPHLSSDQVDWDSASDPSEDYNCMGFAMGPVMGLQRWWSPPNAPDVIQNPRDYWPENIVDDSEGIDAFIEAAKTRGFERCDDGKWENDVEKIVLLHRDGVFTHASLLISPNLWKSKFGPLSDFPHTLEQISGYTEYGDGREFMKRPRQSSAQ
jgi:hypothetical protein